MLVNIPMTNQIAFITFKVEIYLWFFMLWNFIRNLFITTVLHQTINFITPESLYAKHQCLYHLLIPSGYIKTTTTNFEQNLKKKLYYMLTRTMDTGQIHPRNTKNGPELYYSGAYKDKTHKAAHCTLPAFIQSLASIWCPDRLPACILPAYPCVIKHIL